MDDRRKDTARVIAPPPLLFFACLIFGSILSWLFPESIMKATWTFRFTSGLVLMSLAGVVAFFSFRMFKKHRTPFDPYRKTKKLILDGPFRYSRNPLYLSLVLVFSSFVLLTASIWMLFFLIVLYLLLRFGAIGPEEEYLEKIFGKEYVCYKAEVRRWL